MTWGKQTQKKTQKHPNITTTLHHCKGKKKKERKLHAQIKYRTAQENKNT